jgi:hypothetical protein
MNKKESNKSMNEFIEYLRKKKFRIYTQISDDEITHSMHHNKVIIEAVSNNNGKTYQVGIDPAYCFNKLRRCSVLANFPMSRREYKRLIKFINHISNPKDRVYRQWYKDAPKLFYGEYDVYGE